MSTVMFLFIAINLEISSSAVVQLKDADFDKRIVDYEMALVMFYAPWCGHSKSLEPEFEIASEKLIEAKAGVQLVKVDCSEGGEETCDDLGVTSYPTLKIFQPGVVKNYDGPRNGLGIVKFMTRQVGPSAVQIKSEEDLLKLVSGEDSVVVGFFVHPSPLKRAFFPTADLLRDKLKFGHTSVPALLEKIDGSEKVVLFRPEHLHNTYEPSQLEYSGKYTTSALESWLKANLHGMVDQRTRDNAVEFALPLVVAYFNVDFANNADVTNFWRNRILMVAENYTDFNFAISSWDEFENELAREFGITNRSNKPVVVARNAENVKFVMSEEFSVNSFGAFVKKLQLNQLKPFMKSEPLPKDNTKPLKVAVNNNFDDVVMNNNKDTLLEFYAPWCGHCKKLAPIWEQLAENMLGEDVAIVKMDASANDVPAPFEVQGFPTIFWVPKKGKDSPVKYSGERELKDFIKYIAKHATYELRNFDRSGKPRAKAAPQPRKGARSAVELSDVDFKSSVGKHELALVMFYAPWCGHCKSLKPEFDKASSQLAEKDPPIRLFKMDCTGGGRRTCVSFGAKSYPTLKVFKKGVPIDYKGPRYADGIVTYMVRQIGPSAVELFNKDAYNKSLLGEEPVVMGYFIKDSSTLKKAFLLAADKLHDRFKFVMTSSPNILADNDSKDGVVLFRPKHLENVFEPKQLKYAGRGTLAALEEWLKVNMHGLVDPRTKNNLDDFDNPLVVAYYKVDYANNTKTTNYWRNRVLKVAKDYASDFNFAVSSIDEFRSELEGFGYQHSSLDKPVVCARDKDSHKYVMSEEFSTDSFESFLIRLKNKELEPYKKSDPIPENNDGHVKIAVAKNFYAVVVNNDKDTLIEFYAPWCGHCVKLAPIWDRLGEKMANEDVAVVKMDASANDVPPPFVANRFPTIYWASKNGKNNPVRYSGPQELKDFIKYVAKHATHELKKYDRSGKLRAKTKKDEL